MLQFEVLLLSLWTCLSLLVLLIFAGVFSISGTLDLDLYRLFSFAAVLGWVSGNVYVLRRAAFLAGRPGLSIGVEKPTLRQGEGAGGDEVARRKEAFSRLRWRLLLVYLFGPPSIVYLVRTMASSSAQQAAPLVPLLSFGVFTIFFLVPVTLKVGRSI